jgi:putative ABC transport system permease protein
MAPVLLRIAARSLRRNWRHTAGAALAVAVSFSAIALFDAYLTDMEQMFGEMVEEQYMMGTLLVEGTGASDVMSGKTASDEPIYLGAPAQAFLDEYLRARKGEVAEHFRSLLVYGIASNGRSSTPYQGWGYEPAEAAVVRRRFAWDAWTGRPLQESPEDSVLLAPGLAGLLECVPGSDEPIYTAKGLPIPKARPFQCRQPRLQLMASTTSGQINAVTATVAGTATAGRAEMDQVMAYLPLALAQRLANTRDVSMYTVLLRDPSTAARFSSDLSAAAAGRGLAIDAMPWQQSYFGETFRQGMAFLRTFRSLMAMVVFAIAGAAVFSSMVKTVNERTREIGTLRSLGFLRRQITALFTLEAAILSTGACVAGFVVTLAVSAAVNHAGLSYKPGIMATPIPLGLAVEPLRYLGVAALLVGISVFAAWRPARGAARAKIPDALAYA